jgi:hypothetical protein
VQKTSPPLGFDLWNAQPVASCYTDCTTSAHNRQQVIKKAIWEIINKAAGKSPQYVHKIEFYNGTEKTTDLQKVTVKLNSPPNRNCI